MADLFERAVALEQAGHLGEAEQLCRQIVASEPRHAGALLLMGIVRAKSGDLNNALALLSHSLSIHPSAPLGHYYRAMVLAGLGRTDEALVSCQLAVEVHPQFAEAHCAAGNLLLGADRLEEALAAFERSLALRPEMVEALCGKAVALARLKRNNEARAEFDALLAKYPDNAPVLNLRGKLHYECGRYEEALRDCSRSIALGASQDALINRANIFRALSRSGEAWADAERAMALDPNSGNALFMRALVHSDFGRFQEAVRDYQRAAPLLPNNAAVFANLGGALAELGRLEEAREAFDRAIAIDADLAKAYFGRGEVWRRLFREDLALKDFERAGALDPALMIEPSQRLHLSDLICDWRDRAARVEELAEAIRSGMRVSPWNTLTVFDDPELHLLAARRLAEPPASEPLTPHSAPHERLRIAYLSPDFRDHVLAWQIVELIERHDRSRFEVFGISLVDWPESPILARLSNAFEHFIRAGSRNERGTAELIASLGIDIAVDLAGYTDRHKAKLFTWRPAPLAVSYLGHPGTLGSENIDYVLADTVTIPPECDRFYSERVARLPDCFFPLDTTMLNMEPGSRADAGLPESGFVFCAFNNTYKISPQVFDVWMRLLRAVDGSILWLNAVHETARANLRAEAGRRGVAAERLIFAGRDSSRWRHLARLKLADLYLDCVPYNAHSTATDLLRVGVPLLTCLGRSFAARVAASMLTNIGVPELIAHDLEHYEALALELARSPERLAALRARIVANAATHPIFDMTRLARQMEAAYETMWKLHQEGAPPASFTVPKS